MMEQEYRVTVGSRYSVVHRITATQAETFEGVYRGMSVIGSDTALVFDVGGRKRMVVASLISVMDELEAAPEEPEKKETSSAYYG